MQLKAYFAQLFAFSRLDMAAMICALLLSLACLVRGAVDDGVIAIFLLALLLPLGLALSASRPVHPRLKAIGTAVLAFLLLVLCLQRLLHGDTAFWQQVHDITGHAPYATVLHDHAAWLQGLGRLLLFVIVFIIALCVGASESSVRLFLQTLLYSGTLFVALTFFYANNNDVPANTRYFYHHGFVNPNNAAAYLGLMWLLSLAQALRFFKLPLHPNRRMFIDLLDQLTIGTILKGGFLLFATLLTLAALLSTGSRGGILASLFCGACMCLMVLSKINLRSTIRKIIIALALIAMGSVMVWSFINFGEAITSKLSTDGFSSNTRLDIYAAVLPMIADHPLLGAGLGSFPAMFQLYRPETISADGIIDKAHNSYLEFASEMGLPAFFVLMLALAWAGFTLYCGIRSRKERYVVPLFGFSAWLLATLYSLVDFPLQIPGLCALFLAIVTVCVSQTDPRFSEAAQNTSTFVRRRRVRVRSNGKPAHGRYRTRAAD